jgi:rhomboid protease GluP
MRTAEAAMESGFGVYEQLVHELGSRDSRGVVLLGCNPELCHFALPEGTTVFVLRHLASQPELLEANLRKVLDSQLQGRLQLVAVGGDDAARARLQAVAGRAVGRRVEVFAVDDRGELWRGKGSRAGRELAASLDEVRRSPGRCRLDPPAFQTWLQERAVAAKQTIERIRAYQKTLMSRTPWATRVLVVSIALVFGLEYLWGGPRSISTLVRMGALVGDGAAAADPWRPLSSSFLHGGLMHAAGNLAVLYLIGSFLERLVGPWRLVILWVGSVLGGSVAALLFSDARLMVGASGGGWGLMCAAGVLAVRPSGLIPDAMAIPLRKNVGQILLLNLFISFIPGIALSAHLGGGIAGTILALTGLSTLGMRSAEREVTSARRDPMTHAVAAVGVLAAVLLYGSIALALVQGQPWLSGADGPWTEHALDVPDLSIELPEALGEPRTRLVDDATRERVYGDGMSSPWMVTVRVTRFQPKALTSLRLFREYRQLKRALDAEELPVGMTRVGEPVEGEVGKLFTLLERFARDDGGETWRHVAVMPTGSVMVSVETSPEAVADGDQIHERVFSGLKTGFEQEPGAQEPAPQAD